jgi:hypothetical protein
MKYSEEVATLQLFFRVSTLHTTQRLLMKCRMAEEALKWEMSYEIYFGSSYKNSVLFLNSCASHKRIYDWHEKKNFYFETFLGAIYIWRNVLSLALPTTEHD